MCLLCLADFEFIIPEEKPLEKKKKRAAKIKSLLSFASFLETSQEVCEVKVSALKEEQYVLSREF